jgi:hypothetical protein
MVNKSSRKGGVQWTQPPHDTATGTSGKEPRSLRLTALVLKNTKGLLFNDIWRLCEKLVSWYVAEIKWFTIFSNVKRHSVHKIKQLTLKVKMSCNDLYQVNMYVKFKYLTSVQSFTKMWWLWITFMSKRLPTLNVSWMFCGKRKKTMNSIINFSNFLIRLDFYKNYVNVLFEF